MTLRRSMRDFGFQERTAAPLYAMPYFEDGSRYEPESEVYTAISERVSPDVWNALSDEAKWDVIDAVRPQTQPMLVDPKIQPPTRPREPLTVAPPDEGAGPALGAIARGATAVRASRMPFDTGDMSGLFGSRRERGR